MGNKTCLFRIRLKDWKAIRKVFPAYRGETAADYVGRLREWIKQVGEDG